MVQNSDSGGVVMVYADYVYMLEKKEKVLQKKIASHIWEGPGLYTPCAKKHMCFLFFIVPSSPKCSHDKLPWSCFLCLWLFSRIWIYTWTPKSLFPSFVQCGPRRLLKGISEHTFVLCLMWHLQAIQWLKKEKKKTVRDTSGVAGEFPVLHSWPSLPTLLPCLRDYLVVWRSWSKDSAMFYW